MERVLEGKVTMCDNANKNMACLGDVFFQVLLKEEPYDQAWEWGLCSQV